MRQLYLCTAASIALLAFAPGSAQAADCATEQGVRSARGNVTDTNLSVACGRANTALNRVGETGGAESGSVAMGISNVAGNADNPTSAVALGYFNTATGIQSVAIGRNTTATGGSSVAMGNGARATEQNTVSFGLLSAATGRSSIAFGSNARSTGAYSLTFGIATEASGTSSMAIGFGANATGNNTIAIKGTASGESAVTLGVGTEASGQGAYAIGTFAKSRHLRSIAIGDQTETTRDHQIMLGREAYTITATGILRDGAANDRVTVIDADGNLASTRRLTLTDVGLDTGARLSAAGLNMAGTQISNVAAAQVVQGGTHAATTGQLWQTDQTANNALTNAATAQEAAEGAQVTADTAIADAANAQTTADTALADAAEAYELAATGWNIGDGVSTANVAPGASANIIGSRNIVSSRDGTNIGLSLADDINLRSVTTSLLQIQDGPTLSSAGYNGRGTRIVNIGESPLVEGGRDGATTGQVWSAGQRAQNAQDTADAAQQTADTALNNAAVAQNTADAAQETANTALNNAAEAHELAAMGWNIGDGSSTGRVAPGGTVNVTGGNNITTELDGTNINVSLADDITVESVTSNLIQINNGPIITAEGYDGRDTRITNIAESELVQNGRDAATTGQVYRAMQASTEAGAGWTLSDGTNTTRIAPRDTLTLSGDDNIRTRVGADGTANVSLADEIRVRSARLTDDLYVGGGSLFEGRVEMRGGMSAREGRSSVDVTASRVRIAHGDNGLTSDASGTVLTGGASRVSLTDIGMSLTGQNGEPVRIRGVARGVEDTDAVNVSQLRESQAQMDARFAGLSQTMSGGIAGAMAMAQLPHPSPDQQSSLGFGIGAFNGSKAVTIGTTIRLDDNWTVRGALSKASGSPLGAAFAAGYSW